MRRCVLFVAEQQRRQCEQNDLGRHDSEGDPHDAPRRRPISGGGCPPNPCRQIGLRLDDMDAISRPLGKGRLAKFATVAARGEVTGDESWLDAALLTIQFG